MEKHEEFLARYFQVEVLEEQQLMLKNYLLSLPADDLKDFVLGNLRALKNESPGLSPSESAEILAILSRMKIQKGVRLEEA